MPLKVGKAVGFLVFALLCGMFWSAGGWIAGHLITHYTGNGLAERSSASSGGTASRPTPILAAAVRAEAAPTKAQPASPPVQDAPATSPPSPVSLNRRPQPPLVAQRAIVLQVAALTREDDANAMAAALQQKQYPAFVLMPTNDGFYRVQLGPYAIPRAAKSAKRALQHDGYDVLIRR